MVKKKNNKEDLQKVDKGWLLLVLLLSFVISFGMSLISELIIPNSFVAVSIFLVLIFIFLGIIFDMIGLAVATAEEKSFHAMATKNVKGARTAINFINNKDKVASVLNDVVGDICGVVSGSCGLAISLKLSSLMGFDKVLNTVIVTSIISALTIGGKAFGKSIAINNCNSIVYSFSKFINIFIKSK